jgi:uncharacterized protein YbaR (Trm112 family)
MIDEELRAILACPACKGIELTFEETRIICRACRKAYPVRDGIPVMLISEAEPWAPTKYPRSSSRVARAPGSGP